jgi:hypothetical protein
LVFIDKQEDRQRILFLGGKNYTDMPNIPQDEAFSELFWDTSDRGRISVARYRQLIPKVTVDFT